MTNSRLNRQIKSFLLLLVFFGFTLNKLTASSSSEESSIQIYVDVQVQEAHLLRSAVSNSGHAQTVYLFSHGKPGHLLPEGKWRNPTETADWLRTKGILRDKSQINIYGCNYAQGKSGLAAVSYLEKTLGISVSASDDISGPAGNWTLEVGSPAGLIDFSAYPHNLQSCNCEDYIYLNEVSNGGQVHKYRIEPDSTLFEIFTDGGSWYPGTSTSQLPSPHGLATDINGFLYIAESFSPGQDIRKLTCDGGILPETTFAVPSGDKATNLANIGNTIYTNTGLSYDICTQTAQGTVCMDGLSSTDEKWGFWYDELTGYFYSTSSDGINGNLYRYTASDWGSGTCVQPFLLFDDIYAIYQDSVPGTLTAANSWTRGVSTDENGNIFLTLWVGGRPSNFNAAVIKFSPDGSTVLAHTAIDVVENDGGWYWATAPVYSPDNDVLYVSTQSPIESCVYAFSGTDLTPLFEVVAPGGDSGQGQSGFNQAKAMAINKECCPANTNETINAQYCTTPTSDAIFLNEIFPCEGTVCNGTWTAADAASTAVFDPCNQTIITGTASGCYSFTRSGDASHPCGVFTQELNIEIINVDDISIASDGACGPVTLTATTLSTNIKWQSTTTAPLADDYVDIPGATSMSIMVSPTEPTYYRAVVISNTTTASGNCPGGNCELPSNVITVNQNIVAQAHTIQASCVSGTPQNDAYLLLSQAYNATHYNFSSGSTYSGSTDINAATAFDPSTDLPLQLAPTLNNPTGMQDYTIRIFNANNSNCFIDVTVTLSQQDCTVGCDCDEFVYLNEPGANATLKFEVNTNGSLTEINSPTGGYWMQGVVNSPHGLATDLNGFLYIGNITFNNGVDPATRGVDKVTCDGTLSQADVIPPAPNDGTTGSAGYATNMYSRGNTIYMNNWAGTGYPGNARIFAYDICVGSFLGEYTLCDVVGNAWDFLVDTETNELIVNAGNTVAVGDLDANLNGPCLNTLFTGAGNRGIVRDEDGFFYKRSNNNLYKYDTVGNLIFDVDLTLAGGSNAWGLVYSEEQQLLYLGGNDADCISVYDKNGNYVSQGAPNSGGAASKAIALNKECCPINNNQTIDTVQCVTTTSSPLFLNEIFPCDGSLCNSEWIPTDPASAAVFDACAQTINSGIPAGCYSYERSGDVSHPCGVFFQRMNLEIIEVEEISIALTGPACGNTTLTATTTATNIKWQSSLTSANADDFADIPGETAATLSLNFPGQTTYYRAVVVGSNPSGSGSCPGGNCEFPSNVITVDPSLCLFSLGNQVFYDDDNSGDLNGNEGGIDGVQLQLLNADGSVYDSDPSTSGIQALSVTTANGGYYRFDDLPAGNYIVEVVPGNFSGGALENYLSSTGAAQEANPDTDGDSNDNGLDALVAGAVRSDIITLAYSEPSGETEPGTYAAGSTTGTAVADEFNNLTVDFGFFRQRDRPDCCDDTANPCADEPCHFISNDIYFGNGVTNDPNSNSNATADADADDGLLWGNNLNLSPGGVLNLPVSIYNNTGNDAYFRVWIDWNDNGDFADPDEKVADEIYLAAVYNGSFLIDYAVTIPSNVVQNQNLALRMRLSTDDTDSTDPCGNGNCAEDGEIEDYLLRFNCPDQVCTGISILIRSN